MLLPTYMLCERKMFNLCLRDMWTDFNLFRVTAWYASNANFTVPGGRNFKCLHVLEHRLKCADAVCIWREHILSSQDQTTGWDVVLPDDANDDSVYNIDTNEQHRKLRVYIGNMLTWMSLMFSSSYCIDSVFREQNGVFEWQMQKYCTHINLISFFLRNLVL